MKKGKFLRRTTMLLLILALCLPLISACGENEDTAATASDPDPTTLAINNDEEPDDASPISEDVPESVPEVTEPPAEEAEPEPDSGTAVLIGIDFETKGNWVGTYGSEGHIIYIEDDSLTNLPDYASVTFDNESVWTWWDSDSGEPAHDDDEELAVLREESALLKSADSTSRIAACWYDGDYFSVTVNVGDTPRRVTLYMNDYDRHDRAAEVIVKNKNGRAMQEPADKVAFEIDDYLHGAYITYEISGEVMFEFHCFSGNVVLSGIFFDPVS